MRSRPPPRSTSTRAVGPASPASAGVSVRRTSATGAQAVTTSESGADTVCAPAASRQLVRMESESLPTGIAMPSAGHNASPRACTVSYRSASSAGSPQAAIQFAESLTSPSDAHVGRRDVRDRLSDRDATRGRRVEERDGRPFAERHRLSGRARVTRSRDGDVANRHLPGPDQRIAADHAADAAIADRDQEALVRDGRQAQEARQGHRAAPRTKRRSRRRGRRRRAAFCCMRGGRPSRSAIGMSTTRSPVLASSTTSRPSSCGLADHGVRAALAAAKRDEALEPFGFEREHVAFLRLVAPDLERRHAGLVGRHAREVDPPAAGRDDFGHRVRQVRLRRRRAPSGSGCPRPSPSRHR